MGNPIFDSVSLISDLSLKRIPTVRNLSKSPGSPGCGWPREPGHLDRLSAQARDRLPSWLCGDEYKASWAASFSPTFHSARLKPVAPTGRSSPTPIPFLAKPLFLKLSHPQLSYVNIPPVQDPSGSANKTEAPSPKAEQAPASWGLGVLRAAGRKEKTGASRIPRGRRERGPLSCTCGSICWQASLTVIHPY